MPSALKAEVAASLIEAVFYGAYLLTLLPCLQALVYTHGHWTPPHLINWPLLMLMSAFGVTSSLDMSLSIRRSITTISQEWQPGCSATDLLWSNVLMVSPIAAQSQKCN